MKFAAASTVSPTDVEPLDNAALGARCEFGCDRKEPGPALGAKARFPPVSEFADDQAI